MEEPIIFARFLNVLFGVLSLYFLYLSCRLLFSETESIAALAFAALLLSQVRFTSLVSNDALLWVISSAFMYLILRQPGGAKVWYEKVALVLISIAGLWSKLLFLPMLLVIPAAWFLTPTSMRNRRLPWLALVIPLVCWLPWLYWNWNHWGSILPISVGFGVPEAPFYGLKRIISTVLYAVRSFWSPFDEVWGGGLRPVLFLGLGVVGLMAIILSIQEVFHRFIHIREFHSSTQDEKLMFGRIMICLFAFGLMLLSYVSRNLHYFQSEARHMYAAFTPMVILLFLGCRRFLSPQIGPWILPASAALSYLLFL